MLELRNPHSVSAILQTRPDDVAEIRAATENLSSAWQRVLAMAGELGVSIGTKLKAGRQSGRRTRRGNRNDRKQVRGGGMTALVRERSPVSLGELFTPAGSRGLWLALDQLQDPHNVGAIFRSAAFHGVRGIVLTDARSASLTATVYDVAAGGVEFVPFAVVANLRQALTVAKQSDLWVLGSSEHADQDVNEVDCDRNWLLVIGNEESGLRRLTRESCDQLCRLTPYGPLKSLNASVAAGVLMATLTGGSAEC